MDNQTACPSRSRQPRRSRSNNDAVTRPRAGPALRRRADTVGAVSHLVTGNRNHPDTHDDDGRYTDDYCGYYDDDYDCGDSGDSGDTYDDYDGYDDSDRYDGYDGALPEPRRRRHPGAVIFAAVLVAAGIGTAVILNSDSNGSQATRVGRVEPSPTVTARPAPPSTTATTPSRPPAAKSLAPETITTLNPAVPRALAPTLPTPPPPVNPGTVRYTVTGAKQLLDLVTVVYTDAQGIPRTDFNVALPWNKTVVLNPGVQVRSVVATSLSSRLNCAITNAEGQVIAASARSMFIATCMR